MTTRQVALSSQTIAELQAEQIRLDRFATETRAKVNSAQTERDAIRTFLRNVGVTPKNG